MKIPNVHNQYFMGKKIKESYGKNTNTPFFIKHNNYKHIEAEISEKN